jgi:pantothenate kinase-related protein Tda10
MLPHGGVAMLYFRILLGPAGQQAENAGAPQQLVPVVVVEGWADGCHPSSALLAALYSDLYRVVQATDQQL